MTSPAHLTGQFVYSLLVFTFQYIIIFQSYEILHLYFSLHEAILFSYGYAVFAVVILLLFMKLCHGGIYLLQICLALLCGM